MATTVKLINRGVRQAANNVNGTPIRQGAMAPTVIPGVVPLPPIPEQSMTRTAYSGTPEERALYERLEAYKNAPPDVQALLRALAPPGYYDQPIQEPGLLAQTQRTRDAQYGQIEANNNFYENYVNDRLTNLENTFSEVNASDAVALAAYEAGMQGIELAPLALASSNPADVARQQQTFDLLMGAATGSMDAHTNPEDLARQEKTAALLWELAQSPEITAQEEFIYEQSAQREAQDRRAAMDAFLRNLAARGQLGSGGEIGAMLGAQQTTSQNRALTDLGALANAVDRQMNALGQHAALATNMRNASDAMTSGNMDRRLSGAANAGSVATAMRNASDDIARFNAGETNDYNQFSADFDRLRTQGIFDAKRGVNRDVASRADRSATLGIGAQGTILNNKNLIPTSRLADANTDLSTGIAIAGNQDNWFWNSRKDLRDSNNEVKSDYWHGKGIEKLEEKDGGFLSLIGVDVPGIPWI